MHLCENAATQTYTGCVLLVAPPFMAERHPRGICVDVCLALEITRLWAARIETTGCCCGHGRQPGYIGVTDDHIPEMKRRGYQVIHRPDAPERLDSFYPKTKFAQAETQ